MRTAGRPLVAESKLADAIRADGRPAYVIAALAGLKDHQLWAYYTKRAQLSAIHVRRLCAVLECDPEDIEERE